MAHLIPRLCETCGNTFSVWPTRARRNKGARFCSVACWESRSVPTLIEAFWAHTIPCQHGLTCSQCCWTFRGKHRHGYGVVVWHQRNYYAHRIAWEIAHECSLPDYDTAHCIRHVCNNPGCVNASHLLYGTHQDNSYDKIAAGRLVYGEACYQAKLTVSAVQEARILRQQGWTWRQLAQRYGVTEMAVSNACRGKTWKHVP